MLTVIFGREGCPYCVRAKDVAEKLANELISAYPTYYVIDEQLAITAHSMGYSTELGLRMRTLD